MKCLCSREFLLLVLFALVLLILTPFTFAYARSGHLVLLTVAETEDLLDEPFGGTADLYLEIRPGTGRIFIDSSPLTKLDTQGSTRYANRVACSSLGEDCSRYDFFYTIRANSSIVGGPSAGGAIAVLTASMLASRTINESVAITGTINSGGIIGPVGGIKEKTEAAKAAGIQKVLVSAFSYPTELNRTYLAEINRTKDDANFTLNVSRLYLQINLSELALPVEQVATLDEALDRFAGREPRISTLELVEDESYAAIMHSVAGKLCERLDELERHLLRTSSFTADQNLSMKRRSAAENASDWYSAASYCFSDLIKLRTRFFESLSEEERRAAGQKLLIEISAAQSRLAARNLTTLADLETYLIVQERLTEAADVFAENRSNISAAALAFATERYNSADVWSAFFRMESSPYHVDQQLLAAACDEKLREAEERISYAGLYFDDELLKEARDELTKGVRNERRVEYALCLFRASKAAALADLYIGSLSVPTEKVADLVEKKLDAVETVIAKQEAKGFFPILGYSYYRYSRSLVGHDPVSALTFSEYALELSNIDMYFPQERNSELPTVDPSFVLLFLSGVLLGAVLGIFVMLRVQSRRKKSRR